MFSFGSVSVEFLRLFGEKLARLDAIWVMHEIVPQDGET